VYEPSRWYSASAASVHRSLSGWRNDREMVACHQAWTPKIVPLPLFGATMHATGQCIIIVHVELLTRESWLELAEGKVEVQRCFVSVNEAHGMLPRSVGAFTTNGENVTIALLASSSTHWPRTLDLEIAAPTDSSKSSQPSKGAISPPPDHRLPAAVLYIVRVASPPHTMWRKPIHSGAGQSRPLLSPPQDS
jgi:hypothetical protein